MQCQLCKENQASIKIAQIINKQKIEINLCKTCAEKRGVDNPLVALPQIFGSFIAELIGKSIEVDSISRVKKVATCRGCGLTWQAFEKTGLFGCDICYQTFKEDLNTVLRRIHGSNQHIGNRPKSQRKIVDEQELQRIKLELSEAVDNENFERAAELRDLMRGAQQIFEQKDNDGILR